jgi:hypothetical protein
MKKINLSLWVILFFLVSINAYAQDSLKYSYAILKVDMPNASVEYSNGVIEDLQAKLDLSKKGTHNQAIFRCFEYLNDNGYEMQSSNMYLQLNLAGKISYGRMEYVFKRKRVSK